MSSDTNEHINEQRIGVRTAADIANELLDSMPEPQPHAIAAAPEAQEIEIENVVSGETDESGEVWNPELHATGFDGFGVKTAKGLWRRRRGAGISRGSIIGARKRVDGTPPMASVSDIQARAAGVSCAHALFIMGRAIGGEEWSPRDDQDHNETRLMESAFGDYFVATGRTEFPPGLALTMAVSAYALPRFTMPQTKTRMTRFRQWIAVRWIALRDRKKPKSSSEISRAVE